MKKSCQKFIAFFFILNCVLCFHLGAQNQHAEEYFKEKSKFSSVHIPKEQILKDCVFFGGDTLQGFPLEKEVEALVKLKLDYTELKLTIKDKEVHFVHHKYGMPEHEPLVVKTHPITSYSRNGPPTPLASVCNNLDFEDGNFNGWNGYEGYNSNSNGPLNIVTGPITPPTNANSAETSCNYFSLVNTGVDPWSGVSVVSPLGGWSARLGGENRNLGGGTCATGPSGSTVNTAGEILEKTFLVTSANTGFQYAFLFIYADNGTHPNGNQPYFKIDVLDAAGNPINCLNYYQQGLNGSPPTGYGGSLAQGYFYTPAWVVSSLNLLAYMGQNVTIRFSVAGCTQTAHFGYAYVDCACKPLELLLPTTVCQGTNATITAPPVAGGSYSWSGPGVVGGGTSQVASVNASGTYTVTITYGANCTYSLDTNVVINPVPVVSVNSPTTCPGVPVGLNASSTGSAGTLNYTWTPSGGLSTPNDSVTTATVNSTTSYTVTGISANNCTNSAVATITIPPTPPPTFSASPVCIGNPTLINNTTPPGGTFSWDFGDGSGTVANQYSPSHTYTTSGTFVVSSTVNVGGCTGTSTVNVTVNPNPTVTATGTTICSGTGPTSITGGGASTYTWSTGGTGATLSVNPSVTTSYTVTGTNANSCTNTAVATVTVLPTPTLAAVGDKICAGFTANISCGGANSYAWTGPNILTGANNANCTANPATTSNYTVVGTSATCTASAVVTVTVSPNPTVTVSNMGPFCPGDVVPSQTFTSNPANPSTTFQWTNNNPSIGLQANDATSSTPSFTSMPNASLAQMQAVVTVTPTLNSCVGAPASFTITVNPTPLVSPGPDLAFCPSVLTSQVNFNCVPVGGSPTYYWTNLNPNIGLGGSGSGNLPPFTTVNTGTTAVTATILVHASLNNCPGPDSVLIITINPNPKAAFVYSSACIGAMTTLTDESTVGIGTINYWNWDLNNDGVFMDATNATPSLQFTPAGWHNVGLQVTSDKGCKNQVYEQIYVNPLPLADFDADNKKGCPVLASNFTFTPSGLGIKDWSWDFGNGQTSVSQFPTTVLFYNSSPTAPIWYDVSLTVTSDSGCTASKTRSNFIEVYPQPIAGFDWDPADADVLDPTIHFYNTSVGGNGPLPIKYFLGDVFIGQQDPRNWTNLTNPIYTYNDQTPYTYYVTQWVKNIWGCRDSITHPITINPAYTFYIPNAFSPNGDGRNEGFKGTGIGIDTTTYNLWVFDRWGNEIFHSTDLEETWNGRVNNVMVQEDVYVWKVRFSDISGTKHDFHGTVSLIK